MNVSNEARPYLYDLREKINESVHLAILDETEIMYVYNLEGTHAIRMRSDIGVRKPAYCTAEGQAILAFQPNDVVDRVIEAGLEPRTPKTITSAEKFIKALGATRQRGCAIEDEESEIGMVCIAAPIRDDSGDVIAAVGIAGPLTRLSKKSIAAVMPHVIATADLVSARLGYRGRTQA
jgi:DNA-binding IclR family transcriptional regulator